MKTRAEQTRNLTRQRQRKISLLESPAGNLNINPLLRTPTCRDIPLVKLYRELDAGHPEEGHQQPGGLVDVDVGLVENHPEGGHCRLTQSKVLEINWNQFDAKVHEDANRVGECG